jgi:hypothetical protein
VIEFQRKHFAYAIIQCILSFKASLDSNLLNPDL